MAVYLKKVEAVQFMLSDEDKEHVSKREPVLFEGSPVKHVGGENYVAVLKQGENQIRIYVSQWLVRHPDGLLQIFWPDKFAQLFIKGSDADAIKITQKPLMAKSNNQPTIIL